MDSVGRTQFLVLERWRLSLSRPLSSGALLLVLLIGISNLAMDWGISLLVPWLSDSPSASCLWLICSSSAFFKNSLSHLLICCVDVGKEKHTCCVWMLQSLLFFPLRGPGNLTQGISLGHMCPFICFQGLVSWHLVPSGNGEQSPCFIAILLANTIPSAKSLHSNL